MAWDGRVNVLVIGGGMQSQEVVIPTILQERRKGSVATVAVSALDAKVTSRVRHLFPDEPLRLYPDPEQVDDLSRPYPELYKQAIGELGRPGLVYVATPDHLHTPVVLACIEAGLDVCCMKPLCLKVAEAWQIVEAAERTGAYVLTEYHKRKDRAVRALRQRYRAGELGEVLYGHAWIEEPKYMPLKVFGAWAAKSSPFEYIGTHYVDVYHYVTGLMPRRVVGFGQRKFLPAHGSEAYDAVQAVIEWEDGSAFWIQTSWVCCEKNSAMTNQGMMLQGTLGEYWSDHKDRNTHFVTERRGYEDYNPNYFKPYDSWDESGRIEYVGYGYESNQQAIVDVIHLHRQTEGLSAEEARAKRQEIIGRWEQIGARALPRQALVGVAVNEAVRLSVDNASRFVAFDQKLYPHLQ